MQEVSSYEVSNVIGSMTPIKCRLNLSDDSVQRQTSQISNIS